MLMSFFQLSRSRSSVSSDSEDRPLSEVKRQKTGRDSSRADRVSSRADRVESNSPADDLRYSLSKRRRILMTSQEFDREAVTSSESGDDFSHPQVKSIVVKIKKP